MAAGFIGHSGEATPKKNPKPALFSWDDAESMDLIQMCGNSGKNHDKPMGFLNHCREDCPLPS